MAVTRVAAGATTAVAAATGLVAEVCALTTSTQPTRQAAIIHCDASCVARIGIDSQRR